jgi:hypothetical protein
MFRGLPRRQDLLAPVLARASWTLSVRAESPTEPVDADEGGLIGIGELGSLLGQELIKD